MARIDDALIHELLDTCRLALNEEDVAVAKSDLGHVLSHIALLSEVDLTGVEPMFTPSEQMNVMRKDKVRPGLLKAQAMGNAPKTVKGMFVVPSSVE